MAAKPPSWREIQNMKNELWQYENDVKTFKESLTKTLETLKYDPDNAKALKDKEDLEVAIREFTIEVESIREKLPPEEPKPENAAPKKPKVEVKVGDHVLAHRNNEPRMVIAKVISITGSAQNAVYQIRFKDKFLQQVRADAVRPATKVNEMNAEKKRKADEEAAANINTNPNIITAQPQLKREPSLASAGPDRPAKIPRKLGSEKKLEKARGTWQQFQSKQKKTKESMFRSGDSLTSRVGFLGSGKPMTQTEKRVRHVHGEIIEE